MPLAKLMRWGYFSILSKMRLVVAEQLDKLHLDRLQSYQVVAVYMAEEERGRRRFPGCCLK